MRKHCLLLLAAIFSFSSFAETEKNIIISNWDDHFTLVPHSRSSDLKIIKRELSVSYQATQVPDKAFSYILFSDSLKLKKAKAPGTKPVYKSATSSGILYDDSKVCSMSIELNKINTDYVATFETEDYTPQHAFVELIGAIYPIKEYNFSVSMPIELKDRYDFFIDNKTDDISIDRFSSKDGKSWIVKITAHNLNEVKFTDDTPSPLRVLPVIRMSGIYSDVNSLYARMRSYIVQEDPAIETVADKTKEIIEGCQNEFEKISKIYDWVHENIRYIAIEHNEYGHKPDLASNVLSNRYGDCKGSASLLKQMLIAAGIDARLVWIGTDNIPHDWTDVPDYSSGNHMIAAAMLPNDSILYLDGTTGLIDLGYYPPQIQNRQTIIENGDRCIVGRVPALPPSVSLDESNSEFYIQKDSLIGKVSKTMTGSYKAFLLNSMRSNESIYQDKILRTLAGKDLQAWSFSNFETSNLNTNGGPSFLKADACVEKALQKIGNKTYLSTALGSPVTDLIFETKKRYYPAAIKKSGTIRRTVKIALPADLTVVNLPKDFSISNENVDGEINYSFSEAENTIMAALTITIRNGIIALDKIEDHNSAMKKLSTAISSKVVLEDR